MATPSARKERLAAALRENLKRRKVRERALDAHGQAIQEPSREGRTAGPQEGQNPAPKRD